MLKKHCTIGGRGLPLPITFENWELSTTGQLFLPFHGSDSFGTVNTVITEIVGKLSPEKKSSFQRNKDFDDNNTHDEDTQALQKLPKKKNISKMS